MSPGASLIVGLIIILVLLVAAAFVWDRFVGWKPFSFVGTVPFLSTGPCKTNADCPRGATCGGGKCIAGVIPCWTPTGSETAAALRFKDCVFSVVDPAGKVHSADVTAVLNGMAAAYSGAEGLAPQKLCLNRPLNAFSFKIKGVNDRATVKTAKEAQGWQNCKTTLVGRWRTI